jgi:NADH dehydrogenase
MSDLRPEQVVVVGGGYAGTLAAVRLAGRARRKAEVTLVDAKDEFVQRLRLHQVAAGIPVAEPRYTKLVGRRVKFVRGSVEVIDVDRGVVELGDRSVRALRFDRLVYAAGSADDLAAVPGVAYHAHRVADRASALRLREALRSARPGARVVVVGGGLTGIEVASELAPAYPGLNVTLVSREAVGGWLTERARDYLSRGLAKLDVETREQVHVIGVEHGRATLADGSVLPFDVVVWCGGFRASPLAARSGMDTDSAGRLVIDRMMRSVSHPHVVGVGDAALTPAFVAGKPLRMACQVAAATSARAADTVLAGIRGREPKPLHFGYVHQPISLGRRDGLIQFVDRGDQPKDRMITGRKAAVYKDLVSATPLMGVRMERVVPGANVWPVKEPKETGLAAGAARPGLPPPSGS